MDDEIAYGGDEARRGRRPAFAALIGLAVVAAAVAIVERQRPERRPSDAASVGPPVGSPAASSLPTLAAPPTREPARTYRLTGLVEPAPRTAKLLLVTDQGPALLATESGLLTELSGVPAAHPGADPPPIWTAVRSGEVIFLHRVVPVQEGSVAVGEVFLLTGQRLRRLQPGSAIAHAAESGHILVVTYNAAGRSRVVELDDSGRQIGRSHALPPDTEVLSGIHDDRAVIRTGPDYDVHLWDLKTRQSRRRLASSDLVAAGAGTVARVSCRAEACVVSLGWVDGSARRRWRLDLGAWINDAKLSPDGQLMVLRLVETQDDLPIAQRLAVLNLATGLLRHVPGTRIHPEYALFYDWAPDSGGLAIATAGHSSLALWRLSDDELQLVVDHGAFINGVLCIEGC